ncbi:unnamed protein product [Rotaria socialis]
MTVLRKSSFETLPVEIVHRIFDYLPTETIVSSIRYVCKRFYSIISGYNNYEVDFRYMARSDLCSMARIIDPKNIISVTLSDEIQTPGQIRLFLTHFQIDQFIRLRSLTLVKVNCKDIDQFQKHIIKCQLTTLSITLCDYYKNDPTALISSLISHSNLRKFEYIGNYKILRGIQWPIQCRLIHVIIGHCSFNILYSIIFHLPYLQTLVVKDIFSSVSVVTAD